MQFEVLVIEDLDTEILGGVSFMLRNYITSRPLFDLEST